MWNERRLWIQWSLRLASFNQHAFWDCCCCSVTKSCPTLCDPMDCSTPGFPVLYYVLEFPQTHVLWVGDAIQPSHLLSLPSPPALNLSQHQGLFQWVSSSHQEAKYWSFSFSISPSSEYSGLISFRTNWLDLLAVQGILKSLLQHYSSKASIFLALSLLYGPTRVSVQYCWKNHSFDHRDLCQQSEV